MTAVLERPQDIIREYPPEVVDEVLAELDEEDAVEPGAWQDGARPDQKPPQTDWRTWYIRGGRGSGKTWTGANMLAEWALKTPGEYGMVAPTFADMRDKCVEGPSGLLKALGTNRVEVERGVSSQRQELEPLAGRTPPPERLHDLRRRSRRRSADHPGLQPPRAVGG